MAALNDAGARVLLIGTGRHAANSGLDSVPAVERSVRDLGEVLVERCGLARERLRVVIDAATPTEIGTALAEEAERATSVLLVYYVGHGLVGLGGELYLATQSTDRRPAWLAHTALAYNAVRNSLLESPATSLVVVLDCCYSGRALGVLGSVEDEAVDLARVHGGFVLTSAAPDELALAPEGDTYTAFTGELLDLLRHGDPKGPPQMTLQTIYRYLGRQLPARGVPRPRRVTSGRVDDLVLAVNPAYRPPSRPAGRPPLPGGDQLITDCPYPGLAAFEPEQAHWFFGRDRLTADLAERLASRLTDGSPLVVVAPSGTGKSSLLRAGLVPALARGELTAPGSRHWPRVLMTPGPHPLAALAAQVAPLAGVAPAVLSRSFTLAPGGGAEPFRAVLRRQAAGRDVTGARVVLIVDQFEEVFTLCADEAERRAFIGLLGELAYGAREADPTGLVVIGLRADFYGRCAEYPELRGAVERDQVLVGPMSAAELREAIERPAQAVGLELEPGLVELLLRDIGAGDGSEAAAGGYEAGRLPLIAYALRETWEQRSGSTLTVAGYETTGGIQHAIATAAEATYAALPAAGREATRPLFLRLVKIGEGAQDTRRSVSGAELLSHSPTAAQAEAALQAFTRARLLTMSEDSVQISHEALLRAWPRLQQWISGDRAGNLLGQQLEDDATGWERSGRDSSVLLRGSRLDTALGWARDRLEDGDVSPVVGSFLRESRRQQARAGHVRRAAVAVLAVVALVAAGAAWFAFRQSSAAQASSRAAILNQVTAEADEAAGTDSSLAAELNVLAYQMKPSSATYTKLISAQDTPLATVLPVAPVTPNSVTFSPSGRVLAAATSTGVQLWDVSSPSPRRLGSALRVGAGGANSVAFSPNGRTLAAATSTGVVLWNLGPSSVPRLPGLALPVGSGAADSVAFSPGSDILAVATGTEVQLWDVSSPIPAAIDTLPTSQAGTVSSVAFSPDGDTLAVAASSLQLWNVTNPALPEVSATIAPLANYSGHPSPFLSVAFSPKGPVLAAGAADAAVHIWVVADPTRPVSYGSLQENTDSVNSVAFSPDGNLLAAGSADQTAALFNVSRVADGDRWSITYPVLTGHTAAVLAVAMSPEGTLATASADHTIRLWHLPRTVLTANGGFVDGLALSPSRGILASASADNTMRLWNVANPADPAPLSGAIPGSGDFDSLSFRPDGQLLAAGEQNTVQLWQVSDPRHPVRIGSPLPGWGPGTADSFVASMAFSPDGRTLAVGSDNRSVQLWDVADPAHPVPLGTPLHAVTSQGVGSVSFSPDGHTLAVGGNDGTIRLWNVADPAHPVSAGEPLTGNGGIVESVAFSPNGQVLASGNASGTVELWDVRDPARASMLGKPLTGQTSLVYAVAFSPDGRTLASGSLDQTIRLWNVGNPSHAQEIGGPLTGDTGGINTLVFGSGGHVVFAADGSYAVRIWNLDPAAAIQHICAATANVLTPQQWHRYVPELPYNPPCGTGK
jgi:WD40 repeat protein